MLVYIYITKIEPNYYLSIKLSNSSISNVFLKISYNNYGYKAVSPGLKKSSEKKTDHKRRSLIK